MIESWLALHLDTCSPPACTCLPMLHKGGAPCGPEALARREVAVLEAGGRREASGTCIQPGHKRERISKDSSPSGQAVLNYVEEVSPRTAARTTTRSSTRRRHTMDAPCLCWIRQLHLSPAQPPLPQKPRTLHDQIAVASNTLCSGMQSPLALLQAPCTPAIAVI